jgi:hypothetical protein
MKLWAVPFLLLGPPLFLFGMMAEANGLIFDLSFLVGGALFVVGVLLLFFLPYSGTLYSGSPDEQMHTRRQDRMGVVVIGCGLALAISALVVWRRFI